MINSLAAMPGQVLQWSRRLAGAGAAAPLVRSWLRCAAGVSTIEFALLAPMLAFSLLATVDLALGMSERMKVGHLLRAGAQTAMVDPGVARVEQAMSAAAGADESLTYSVARYCACPEDLATAVDCSTVCTDSKPTFTYYGLTALKPYSGNFMPPLQFDRAIRVQVR